MADYFLPFDATFFERRLRPAVAQSRRARRFAPLYALCAELLPSARAYAARFHVAEEPLLACIADLPFDRTIWRTIVGELLLYAAVEMPELQSAEATLAHLLGTPDDCDAPREHWSPIRQVYHGSRDLTFGGVAYRPEHAGYHDAHDVARLAAFLSAQQPQAWILPDAEELEDVRAWYPPLVDLYRRCAEQGRVMVIETIY